MSGTQPIYCPKCEAANVSDAVSCTLCGYQLAEDAKPKLSALAAATKTYRAPEHVEVSPVRSALVPACRTLVFRHRRAIVGLGLLGLIPLSIFMRPKHVDARRPILEKALFLNLGKQGILPSDEELQWATDRAEALIDRGRNWAAVVAFTTAAWGSRELSLDEWDARIIQVEAYQAENERKTSDTRRKILKACILNAMVNTGELARDDTMAELVDLAETLIDRGGNAAHVCAMVALHWRDRDMSLDKWDRVVRSSEMSETSGAP